MSRFSGASAWMSSSRCLLALAAAIGASACVADPPVSSGHRLSVAEAYQIPATELSALALTEQSNAQVTALMAGDADYRIARLSQPLPAGQPRVETGDLAAMLGVHGDAPSQWEAIAIDGQGHPCLLAEVSAEVQCLDRDLRKLLAVFRLDPSALPGLHKSWLAEPNSRGEGLILLQRGHLLLLKEKKPALLVEFGPAGDAPIGYGPGSFLAAGQSFDPPPCGLLVALKVWAFAGSIGKLASDASDIALGPDGRVYLLSDESAVLVRLEGNLNPQESKVRASAYWLLPKEIEKPEGLAMDTGLRPWITVDSKRKDQPSLFRLSPITPP